MNQTSIGSQTSQSKKALTAVEWAAISVAALIVLFGIAKVASVWLEIDHALQVFHWTRSWIYHNYGLSEAWSFSLAALAAFAVYLNMWFLVCALAFHTHAREFFVVSALVLIPGAALYEFRSEGQCFVRGSDTPLCDVYKKADGTITVLRKDGSAPPSAWRRLRTASQDDVSRYGATPEERARLMPHRVAWDNCGKEAIFFDPSPTSLGEALVYYVRVDGVFELFDGPGFHPLTRQPLQPVTETIVPEICRTLNTARQQRDMQRRHESDEKAAEARRKAAQATEAAQKANHDLEESRRRATEETGARRRSAQDAAERLKVEQAEEVRKRTERAALARSSYEQARAAATREFEQAATDAKMRLHQEESEAQRVLTQEKAMAQRELSQRKSAAQAALSTLKRNVPALGAQAQAAYQHSVAEAQSRYQSTIAAAQARYQTSRSPAQANYQNTVSAARATHKAAMAEAQRKLELARN